MTWLSMENRNMKSHITILATALLISCFGMSCFAACPAADLTGDCVVNFKDFAVFAEQWLTYGIPTPVLNGMTWVSVSDPGVSGHESFIGEMAKYETTNAQYCQYLNAAKASGAITISGSHVVGASGPYSGHNYYDIAGAGYSTDGATNGGAARINWTGSSFTVDIGFENHPVTYVSFYGSTAFVDYYGWRLPTEWEWQAVADYDGSYIYGCGTTINNSIVNNYGSTHPKGTTVVGAFGAYGYGMCDMAGNVTEWTSSLHGGFPITRGGYWYGNDYDCVVSSWNVSFLDGMYEYLGFRVCH